jgi:hypothetical protein
MRRRRGRLRVEATIAGPDLTSRLLVFEVDQPGPQAGKRLVDLGFGIRSFLQIVPIDFRGRRHVVGTASGSRF